MPTRDIASKFFEHYISLIGAMTFLGGSGLWNEEEGFYFDLLVTDGKSSEPLKVRSAVGLAPMFALCILKNKTLEGLDAFKKRMHWFIDHKPGLAAHIREAQADGEAGSHWISITPHERLKRIMRRVLDESELLSSHGLRALSRAHLDDPFKKLVEVGAEVSRRLLSLFSRTIQASDHVTEQSFAMLWTHSGKTWCSSTNTLVETTAAVWEQRTKPAGLLLSQP